MPDSSRLQKPVILRTDHLGRILTTEELPVTLVKDASVDIRTHEFTAIKGPSGSGKSSFGAFPVRNYSLSAWIAPDNLAANDDKWHHIFSAWAQGSDDPLRVSVQNKRLVVNIEMPDGGAHGPGPELKDGEWTHVAVVKEETQLRLYVNGALIHTTTVPEELKTSATKIGLGCNPNFGEPDRRLPGQHR